MTWWVRQHAQWGQASVEKMLGALPVIAGFCSRLRIRELVDAACPVRDTAELTHGQVIEALVANRLTSPAPLVHVQDWAHAWAAAAARAKKLDRARDDLAGIRLIPSTGQSPPTIPQPTDLQLDLPGLLDIDPRDLR